MTYTALIRSAAPVTTPVTLAEAQLHCEVDSDDDADKLTMQIRAATSRMEEWLGCGIITQTWQQWVAPNPRFVRLEKVAFKALTDVSYYDTDNVLQAAALGDFDVRLGRDRVAVWPSNGVTWPTTYNRSDAIRLTYTVGSDAADVDADIKHAILMLVKYWYDQPEAVTDLNLKEAPMAVQSLVDLHKVGWYG